MYDNDNGSVFYSWPMIIFLLFIFWPVGLYLLIKRASGGGKASISNGKFIRVLGIILFAIGVFGFSSEIADPDEDNGMVVALVFIAIGIALIVKARFNKKSAERINRYRTIILSGGVRRLNKIASTLGIPYETVYKDVKNLIKSGHLNGAYIDEEAKEVVLPNMGAGYVDNTPKQRVVTCKSCGANNVIEGHVGKCEYCDSPLQ